jgi:hypothetical protein
MKAIREVCRFRKRDVQVSKKSGQSGLESEDSVQNDKSLLHVEMEDTFLTTCASSRSAPPALPHFG